MRSARCEPYLLQFKWPPPDVTLFLGGGLPGLISSRVGTLPCDYLMMHLMLPSSSCEKTDTCENITFPQLRLRMVMSQCMLGYVCPVVSVPVHAGIHTPTVNRMTDRQA